MHFLTDMWKYYTDEDYQGCLRFAAENIIQQSGIDLLVAAGASLIRLRRVTEGVLLLKAAATFRPDSINFYHFAAEIAQELSLGNELIYFTILGLRDFPQDAVLQRAHAVGQLLTMEYEPSIAYFESLVAVDPDDINARLDLATTYRSLANFEAAEQHYATVSNLDPGNSSVAIGRAAIHLTLGRSAAARALLEPLCGDHPQARFMLAIDALSHGEYETGWTMYFDRWDRTAGKIQTKPPRPFHAASDVENKGVAILREGGHGDIIQFVRYVPMLANIAAEILLYVLPCETRLLKHNLPANVILRQTTEAPDDYEYTTSIFDMPYHFRTTMQTIPSAPYLVLPAEMSASRRLPPTTRKRVGIVWAGRSQSHDIEAAFDRRRSIKLTNMSGFSRLNDDIEFINLQAGPRGYDADLPMTRVLEPEFDWLDTATIVKQLDLVITVDTAMVHLAGAMGVPTWLLSRSDPCWRWHNNCPDSAWYPGIVRVFGQTTFDDWSPVITTVYQSLKQWCFGTCV